MSIRIYNPSSQFGKEIIWENEHPTVTAIEKAIAQNFQSTPKDELEIAANNFGGQSRIILREKRL